MAVSEVRAKTHEARGASDSAPRAPCPTSPRSTAGGHHLLVDFWVDDAAPLRRAETWEQRLPGACRAAGATVLGARFHQFEPDGVTGVVLLAESHASVHTWPEAGLVTLDVFTCGALDTAAIVDAVRRWLAPTRERVTAVARGDVAQHREETIRTVTGPHAKSPSWTEPAPDLIRGGDRGGGPSDSRAHASTTPCPPPHPRRGDVTSDSALAPPRHDIERERPGLP